MGRRLRVSMLVAGMLVICCLLLLLMHLLTPTPQYVLLSFDTELVDSPEMVEYVLEVLDDHHANATFFVLGSFAQARPDLTRRLARRHEVACHTMTHPYLPMINQTRVDWELEECRRVVENITGVPVRGFRAPYNLLSRDAASRLHSAGYAYDASRFTYPGWLFPEVSVPEIPASTLLLLPLEDSPLVYSFRLGDAAFWLLRQGRGRMVSVVFHPRFVHAHQEAFERLVQVYAAQHAVFLTHADWLAQSSAS